MRKITRDATRAFLNHRDFRRDNTEVRGGQKYCDMFLYGNHIAQHTPGGIFLNNRGYATYTTKDRLNGILEVLGHPDLIVQRKGVWYLGKEVFPNNTWVKVA